MTPKNYAATKIQTLFRKFQEKDLSSKLTPALKKQIMAHLKHVNACISHSNTATLTNYGINSCAFRATVDPESLSRAQHAHLELQQYPASLQLLSVLIGAEKDHFATPKNISNLLSMCYKERSMICDHMAMYLAILLKNDPALASLKDEIYVCHCQGHVFVSIGNPNDNSSLIADPWIKYLDLPPTPGYRKNFSDHAAPERERGFFGDIVSYKNFLKNHPNSYVLSSIRMDIAIIPQYTRGIEGIAREAIENPSPHLTNEPLLSESDIASIHDQRILTFLLSEAMRREHTEIMQMLMRSPHLDLNRQDSEGFTPLARALFTGNTVAFDLLESAESKMEKTKTTAIPPTPMGIEVQDKCCTIQ